MSSRIANVVENNYTPFRAADAIEAVNSDACLALSPGFSGQHKIEPDRYEKTNHSKNNVSKLKDESAQRDSERRPVEIGLC
jgi:hypothetical protein